MGKVFVLESFEDIPQYTGFEGNTYTIKIKDGHTWDGDRYGIAVGFISDDGTVESYFCKDKEMKTTEIFDKLRNDMRLVEKHRIYVSMTTGNDRSGIEYYIPYKVKNHSSCKPTVTETYVDNCSNVRYEVEYEILFVAEEGYTRYITVPYTTEGTYAASFFDQVESIEDTVEEWIANSENGFGRNEFGDIVADFYNEVGEKLSIDINSIRELLSMISSIRVIKCDHIIKEK